MKKKHPILLYFFTLFLSITLYNCNLSLAADKLIAVTELWPPFRISDPTAEYGFKGIDIDILKTLEKHLATKIEIHRHPFARALEMIRDGEADLITGIAHTEKRAKFIRYIPTSYYVVGPVFYTQKGRGHLIKSYEDLSDFQVGYSLNSAYFEPFNSDDKINKVGISTEEQLVKMVALRRLDVTIGTNPNLAYDISRYGLSDKLEQTEYVPEQKTPIYLGLTKNKNNSELQAKIDSAIRQLAVSGELQKILNKYK